MSMKHKNIPLPIKLILFTCMMLVELNISVYAQKQDVENLIGTQLDNQLFDRVKYFKEQYVMEKVSLNDLRGKWLIVYFWTQSCTPCVKKFPMLDDFQKRDSANTQILLIGINDQYNRKIEGFYDGVKLIQKTHLPIAYDSVFVRKMKVSYAGTTLFINPSGVLKEVVLGDLTKKRIKSILARKED